MKTKTFFLGLALMSVTILAGAQNPGGRSGNGNAKCQGTTPCVAFVDENKNGTCDTYEKRPAQVKKGRQNRSGNTGAPGMRQASRQGKGLSFTDLDGDGVCDNTTRKKR